MLLDFGKFTVYYPSELETSDKRYPVIVMCNGSGTPLSKYPAVALSPTNKELAHNLFWDYDATLVQIPIMLISAGGDGDDWVVNGEQIQAIYDDIPSEKLMARRQSVVHNEVLYEANGYVTAWFMWQLQGDEEAGKAFVGADAELMSNPLYQDQRSNIE